MGILVPFILLTLVGMVNRLYKLIITCSLILFITLLTGGFTWILWGVFGSIVAAGLAFLFVTHQNRNSDGNKI